MTLRPEDTYLMKLETYDRGAAQAQATLIYLCAFAEEPFPEFCVTDIGILASAITALNDQVEFMAIDLKDNEVVLSPDDDLEHIVLDHYQLLEMARLSDIVDERLDILRDKCQIRLEIN
tara:strand:+ start:149 stop:505 length:357 start_codon:yes stop_codon:yes gene_type:complete